MPQQALNDLLWPGDVRAGDLFGDAAVVAAMVRVEQAWLHTISGTPVDLSGLVEPDDLPALARESEAAGNPVIPLLSLLRSRLGDAGLLHAGLTSQDVLDTALALCLRETAARVREDLAAQIEALCALADRHRDTPMAGRTLTQHAVPITFGLKAAGWLTGVLDARDVLEAAADLPIQIGGAAGSLAAPTALAGALAAPTVAAGGSAASTEVAGNSAVPTAVAGDSAAGADVAASSAVPTDVAASSAVPTDVAASSSVPTAVPASSAVPAAGGSDAGGSDAPTDGSPAQARDWVARTAAELGLAVREPWHTARAPFTRFADALVTCGDAWGKIANDVLVGSRPEVGEIAEGAAEGRGGSSTMPNKRNPVLAVLVRRAALAAPQLAATMHVAAANAVDERPDGSWHVEWATLRTLARRTAVAASQTAELLSGLSVNEARMAETLEAARPGIDAEQRKFGAESPYRGATDEIIDAVLARAARGSSAHAEAGFRTHERTEKTS